MALHVGLTFSPASTTTALLSMLKACKNCAALVPLLPLRAMVVTTNRPKLESIDAGWQKKVAAGAYWNLMAVPKSLQVSRLNCWLFALEWQRQRRCVSI